MIFCDTLKSLPLQADYVRQSLLQMLYSQLQAMSVTLPNAEEPKSWGHEVHVGRGQDHCHGGYIQQALITSLRLLAHSLAHSEHQGCRSWAQCNLIQIYDLITLV